MIPASAAFLQALNYPKKHYYLKLEFYTANMEYISEFTKYVTSSDLGALSVSGVRPVRRTFSFSLNNKKNEFNWGEDKLVWIDKRVKLYTGLKLLDGNIEYIPQGVFILSEPQDEHTASGKKVSIVGQDKMWLMTDKRGQFVYDTKISKGINVGTAMRIIAEKVGETMFNFDEISETVPYDLTFSSSDNLYKALEDLAKFAKGTIFYDIYGYLTFKKIDLNNFDNEPITWTYKYGSANEKFYGGNVRKMDDTLIANDIVVIGGSSQTATCYYRLTIDENDPIWKGHPYSIQKIGRITYFHNNGNPDSILTTNDECKWRAKYEMMNRLGYAERLSLMIKPNLLHDANDVITISDNENSVSGKYLLQNFTVPLNPQLMSCECVKYRKVIDNWDFI